MVVIHCYRCTGAWQRCIYLLFHSYFNLISKMIWNVTSIPTVIFQTLTVDKHPTTIIEVRRL